MLLSGKKYSIPLPGCKAGGCGLPWAQSALAMTRFLQEVQSKTGWAGKSVKRRQRRMKRADFEEVSRLADAAAAGNRRHDGGQESPAPTHNMWAFAAGDRKGRPYGGTRGAGWRADVGIGPYGAQQRGGGAGRRGHRPLRMHDKRACALGAQKGTA